MAKQYRKRLKRIDLTKPIELDLNLDIDLDLKIKPFELDQDKLAKDLEKTFEKMREDIKNFKIDIDFEDFNKD